MTPLEAVSLPQYSKATQAVYKNTLELLAALLEFNPKSTPDFTRAISDPEKTYDLIKERWPVGSTRSRVMTVLLAVLKNTKAPISSKAKTIYKHVHFVLTRNSIRRNGEMTPRERAAWVGHEEALRMVDTLGREEPGSPAHLLLAFYVLWPPMRGDLGNVRIYATEKDMPADLRPWAQLRSPPGNGLVFHETTQRTGGASGVGPVRTTKVASRSPSMPKVNFLILQPTDGGGPWRGSEPRPAKYEAYGKAPRLVLMNHKTAGSHGRLLRVLPPKLTSVLVESLDANPRDYLFVNANGTPFTSNHSFTVWMGRLLSRVFGGRNVSVNMLRHSYVSSVDYNNTSASSLARLAKAMGHSETVQRRYVLNPSRHDRTVDPGVIFREGAGRRRGPYF